MHPHLFTPGPVEVPHSVRAAGAAPLVGHRSEACFALLEEIQAAGAVFMGPLATVPLGDYAAGPSHVLPTGGTARFSSPLSVDDFVKKSSVLSYSLQALEADGATIMTIAEAEGLEAHAAAVGLRLAAVFGVEDES